MQSQYIIILVSFFTLNTIAQVGIGTTSPQATLDIPASSPTTPSAVDGILIPRIDEFPVVNPAMAQDGMMVFVTGNGTPARGFYYWNNVTAAWILLTNGGGGTDDQQIDVLNLNGTTLEISLEDDGVATQTLDLSSLGGAQRINNLLDGKSDSDGTENGSSIFLGENAGSTDNATDNRNIGIGFESLNTNINGQNNIAIGYQSQLSNRASNNIGIGNFTLSNVIGQGFRNIAIGQNAQMATTAGDDNVAIGDNAMVANTLARFNVAIGTRSLTSTTTNGQNTAVGHESLMANTGGTNTAIGFEALTSNITGIDNVALGHQAGVANSGNGNVFLGKSAGGLETTASNRLYIENSNANADNALIYGEFDNDVLRTNGELQIGNPVTSGYAFPLTDGTANQVLTSDGAGQLSFETVATATDTDDQQIDVLNLNGTTLEISIEDDGVATQILDLSPLSGVERINDLIDGRSDNNGSSIFIGIDAGQNNDGSFNSNVGIGFRSLRLNTSGTDNTAIGFESLLDNTTGIRNTAIGTETLSNITSGHNNVAIGFNSLRFSNAGDGNVAIGREAGRSNNGSGNIFIGDRAARFETTASNKLYIANSSTTSPLIYGEFDNDVLRTNGELQINNPTTTGYAFPTIDGAANQVLTTNGAGQLSFENPFGVERINDLIDGKSDNDGTQDGSSIFLGIDAGLIDDGSDNRNVGLGFNSLRLNTSGFNNVAVGHESLSVNTTGGTNSALGYRSLRQNTSGLLNTAIGASSLLSNTTGIRNNALGASSLGTNTTGNENVAIGVSALFLNTTGNENVALGHQAGFNNNGSGNVFLGRRAAQLETTANNKLYIENSSSDTPLIYGTFNTDEVGINWNSAVALPNTLSVNGNASKTTAGAWLANSDARLKKDIKTMDSQAMLDKVLAMRGVTYFWNDDKTGLERPDTIQYGFIAQDLQEIWPTKVSEDGQGYLQTAYGDYDAMFVAAFKAQQEQIDQLKKENQDLKNQVNVYASLEVRLQQLEELLKTSASPNPEETSKE